MEVNNERLIVDEEPRRVLFISEPYVAYTKAGFTAAADIVTNFGQVKREQTLLISAQSLSARLIQLIQENNNKLAGIEVWIYKNGPEKTSKYVLEE